MTSPTPLTPRSRLLRRVRRGSVLILVVALVVLLALMGTAYLSSTNGERYTAAQNTVNTQGDVVLQNVVDQLRNQIVGNLFDQSQPVPGYRTPGSPTKIPSVVAGGFTPNVASAYHNWDSDLTQPWLASRIPTLRDDTQAYAGDATNSSTAVSPNLAGYDSISWPLTPTPDLVTPGPLTNSPQSDLPSPAYQFYDPQTGNPVLAVGQVFSTQASYAIGDVVSDGPPTNRSYVCQMAVSPGGGTAIDPTSPALASETTPPNKYWQAADQVVATPSAAQRLQPKQLYRYEPTSKNIGGINYPAFRVYNTLTASGTTYGTPTTYIAAAPSSTTMIAADTDGDGIADAGYCLMPGGPVNGITYYYATRVVDNAAALNASTAWSMTGDFDATGKTLGYGSTTSGIGYNPSLFPSNIGMAQLMYDYTTTSGGSAHQLTAAGYWFNGSTTYDLSKSPVADGVDTLSDTKVRADFGYLSYGDELQQQLARRLDNPGWMQPNQIFFRSFTQADGLPLASRFCLAPTDRSTDGALVPLLPELWQGIAATATTSAKLVTSTPYDPTNTGASSLANGTVGWFDANFNYTDDLVNNSGVNTRPLRALTVTRNDVSTHGGGLTVPPEITGTDSRLTTDSASIPDLAYLDVINPLMTPYDPPVANPYDGTHFTNGLTATNAPFYKAGQWIKYLMTDSLGNQAWRVYRCIDPTAAGIQLPGNLPPDPRGTTVATNAYLGQNAHWSLESWTPSASKTSVNTATFPELWRSFYNVMAGQWNTAATTLPDTPLTAAQIAANTSVALPAPRTGVSMFKSPLRYLTTVAGVKPLSDIQMVQLRAALAGVNAMDLRDTDNDVTSRNVILYDDPKLTASARRAAVCATVFGGEKQPFITKVVIVSRAAENKVPWVAVELYNPYVQLQYPTGESAPSSNPVTFHMDAMTSTVPPPAASPTDIYLGARLGIATRATTGKVTLTEAADANGTRADFATNCPTIPPGKYLVLCSDSTDIPMNGATPIVTLPGTAGSPTQTPVIDPTTGNGSFVVSALSALLSPGATAADAATPNELVLFRTRSATGIPNALLLARSAAGPVPAATSDSMQTYAEPAIDAKVVNPALWNMVPMDQFDGAGKVMTDGAAYAQFYFRPTQAGLGTTITSPDKAIDYWKCVFPVSPVAAQRYLPGAGGEFTTLLSAAQTAPVAASATPVATAAVTSFPLGAGYDGPPAAAVTPAADASVPPTQGTAWHVMQVNNTDWPGPHTRVGASAAKTVNIYPIAGFPRNGDMLQVPFTGGYVLSLSPVATPVGVNQPATPSAGADLVEVNSVTMDALYAEDSQVFGTSDTVATADDPVNSIYSTSGPTTTVATAGNNDPGNLVEQVGRFCPLMDTAVPLTGLTAENDPYSWAGRLFDFFSVQAPQDDYMPNADPASYALAQSYDPNTSNATAANPGIPDLSDQPVPTPNSLGTVYTTANTDQDTSAVHGLLNINTASWRALSMLPLVRYTDADGTGLDGTVNVLGSARMAIMIVAYRQAHGPFKSILDLNKVIVPATPSQSFQSAYNFIPSAVYSTAGPTIFAPYSAGPSTLTAPKATPAGNVGDSRQGLLTPNDLTTVLANKPYAYPLFNATPSSTTYYPPNSGVYDDFQTKFLAVDRISNLITTRSDSFTCYVLVQGWQGGKVVVQRRSSFVLDRAPVGYRLDGSGRRVMNLVPVSTQVSGG